MKYSDLCFLAVVKQAPKTTEPTFPIIQLTSPFLELPCLGNARIFQTAPAQFVIQASSYKFIIFKHKL